MWTIDRVIDKLNNLAEADGLGQITVPIVVNGRLSRTLGRVKFEIINGNTCITTKIEFSKALLENGTDNDIVNVIKHEYVHYYLLETTAYNHGHDAVFKKKCAEIGCSHDKTANTLENNYTEKKKFKYEVWCPSCVSLLGTYSRRGKTLNNISNCKCGKCGSEHLVVKQNW